MGFIKVAFNDYVTFLILRWHLDRHRPPLRSHISAACWWLLDTFSVNGCRLLSFIDWLVFTQAIGRHGYRRHAVCCCGLIWGSAALRGWSHRCVGTCTTGGCSSRSLSGPEGRDGICWAGLQIWLLIDCSTRCQRVVIVVVVVQSKWRHVLACFFGSRWCIHGPRVLVKFWKSVDINGMWVEPARLVGYMVATGLLTDFTTTGWLPVIGAEHCWDAARTIKTPASELQTSGRVLEWSFF